MYPKALSPSHLCLTLPKPQLAGCRWKGTPPSPGISPPRGDKERAGRLYDGNAPNTPQAHDSCSPRQAAIATLQQQINAPRRLLSVSVIRTEHDQAGRSILDGLDYTPVDLVAVFGEDMRMEIEDGTTSTSALHNRQQSLSVAAGVL